MEHIQLFLENVIVEFNIFLSKIKHFENLSILIEKHSIRQFKANYNEHEFHTLTRSFLLLKESK